MVFYLITKAQDEIVCYKKIVETIRQIKSGDASCLFVGNLNAKRDWGYAPEYVEAMWLMLQQKNPIDMVITTGETHTVREFIEIAFEIAGYKIQVVKELMKSGDVQIKKNTN